MVAVQNRGWEQCLRFLRKKITAPTTSHKQPQKQLIYTVNCSMLEMGIFATANLHSGGNSPLECSSLEATVRPKIYLCIVTLRISFRGGDAAWDPLKDLTAPAYEVPRQEIPSHSVQSVWAGVEGVVCEFHFG